MRLIRKADVILFAVLMMTAALLFALPVFRVRASSAEQDTLQVVIRKNGKPYGTYALNKDREIHIKSGKNENLVRIRDGSAVMEKSTCRNQVCVDEGKISRAGQSIICLPNRVVVEIQKEKNDMPASDNRVSKGPNNDIDAVVK